MTRIPATRLTRSVKRSPMLLDSMTCTGMFGSGPRTTGMTTTMVHQMMAAPGLMTHGAPAGWSAAAAGTSLRSTAGRRFARYYEPGARRSNVGLSPLQVRCPWPLSPCTLGAGCCLTSVVGSCSGRRRVAGGLNTTPTTRGVCGAGFPACRYPQAGWKACPTSEFRGQE